MGVLRMMLPVPRAVARVAPGAGRPLLGAALLRCLTPDWVLLRPPPTARRLAWAREAVAVYRSITDGSRQDELARALVLHGQALLLMDRCEEAVAALDASSAVPGARPSPTQTASAVHLRAQALLGLGRYEEALESAHRCEELYRARADRPARRDRALGDLPGALRTRALLLGTLGRTRESVAVYEECAGLLRAMTVRESSRASLVTPRVFVELVGGLRALERYEEAVTVGVEAREAVHGTVAWALPQYILPLRVRLLADLAHCESALGRSAVARDRAEEAVTEARDWTASTPDQGTPWLAAALYELAIVLRELESRHEELKTLEELTDLYDRLATGNPEFYAPRLADALDDLARCHKRAGRRREAVAATERGVAACRRTPGHEDVLARLLANLSIRQQDAGDRESALASAREAVTLTRRLAESDWSTYTPVTARRLTVLARALYRTGDYAAAAGCYEEAESLLREQPGTPDDLAGTLADLAEALARSTRAQLSAGRTAEAVVSLRSLLALTRRADGTDVHATCVTAFADAHARHGDAVRQAWETATGEPYPTFVYRFTTDLGRGSKPAAR
ncbi:hypothetical protein ACWDR3_28675 [Streptomyces sp. NPDC001002]